MLGAITSAQQRLKLYNKARAARAHPLSGADTEGGAPQVPTNGLVLYTGTILTDDGKEKKVNIDFEPFKTINTSLYLCDNKFHTEALSELLESENKYGFIVMDGNGALFGTLSGNTREILHKFTVDLPKKHGRGGQSALRFARLRMEKRHNYVRKARLPSRPRLARVAHYACRWRRCRFSSSSPTIRRVRRAPSPLRWPLNDAPQPNVAGVILAGSADFKTELSQSDLFDGRRAAASLWLRLRLCYAPARLQAVIVNIVDVSYGGENGFNQAIELSTDILANVKFIQEKKLIAKCGRRVRAPVRLPLTACACAPLQVL